MYIIIQSFNLNISLQFVACEDRRLSQGRSVRYTRVKGETYLPLALILTLSVMYRRVTHLLLRNKTYVIFV